jgi:hypothetical protein
MSGITGLKEASTTTATLSTERAGPWPTHTSQSTAATLTLTTTRPGPSTLQRKATLTPVEEGKVDGYFLHSPDETSCKKFVPERVYAAKNSPEYICSRADGGKGWGVEF